jgi:hypothetical protein
VNNAVDLNLVTVDQLTTAAAFSIAVDNNFSVLNAELGLDPILNQIGKLEELPQSDRQAGNDDLIHSSLMGIVDL